jgi:hypothetical protein
MPPHHPVLELAAAALFAVALPVSLFCSARLAAQWRRAGMPPSVPPPFSLPLQDFGFFLVGTAFLVVASGRFLHAAVTVWTAAFLIWRGVDLRALWRLHEPGHGRDVLWAVAAYLALLPAIALGMAISLGVGSIFGWKAGMQEAIRMFYEAQSPWALAGFLLLACVAAPVGEEVFFRGLLYPLFKNQWGRGMAVALSSVLFGAMHGHWASFLSLSLLGAVLALAYDMTGRLSRAIALHVVFNSVTCALLLLTRFLAPS